MITEAEKREVLIAEAYERSRKRAWALRVVSQMENIEEERMCGRKNTRPSRWQMENYDKAKIILKEVS